MTLYNHQRPFDEDEIQDWELEDIEFEDNDIHDYILRQMENFTLEDMMNLDGYKIHQAYIRFGGKGMILYTANTKSTKNE